VPIGIYFERGKKYIMLNKGKQGDLEGFLGPNTSLKGELRFKEILRIDGKFDGVVESGGTLQVGESGHLIAKVYAKNMEISGKVEGSVMVTGMVSILHQGKVIGDVTTPILVVEEGAIFDGKCNMMNAKDTLSKVPLDSLEGKGSLQKGTDTRK
jgi:cytoskeletal protein CcmA (bactofilin family)